MTVKINTIKGGERMEQSNKGFMQKCSLCGKADVEDVALSELRLCCGYGSYYDGEVVEVSICGECANKLYVDLSNG